MFTNCPSCSRQFKIRARQLAAAEGLVQCGFCGKQFNALDRLYDKPLIIEQAPEAGQHEDEPVEPDFYIPPAEETVEPAPPPAVVVEPIPGEPANEEAATLSREESVSADEITPDATADPGPVDEVATAPAQQVEPPPAREPGGDGETAGAQSSPPLETPDAGGTEDFDYPFPDELVEEEEQGGGLSRLLWSTGVLILLLAGTAQAAWFNRDILLSRYPRLLPHARELCRQIDCTLVRNRNLSAIKLLNRDVRVHPRYEDALLVNATITNLSSYRQQYPDVLLRLFDTSGEVIAFRRITASEYLDSSIDMEAGMMTDTPIHIVFEVTNSATEAVSFEFDFL